MTYKIEAKTQKDYLKVVVSGKQTFGDNQKLVAFIIDA